MPIEKRIIPYMQEISLSAITTYRECPRWYAYVWIRKTPAPIISLKDYAARHYFALVRQMEKNRTAIPDFHDIESQLIRNWQDQWDPRIDLEHDDYTEKQMKAATVSSLRVAHRFFKRHLSWSCIEPVSTVRKRLPGFKEIFFRHRIHGIYRDDTGRIVCVRHRFGPVRPELEPVPNTSLADAWVVYRLLKQMPDKAILIYPWLDRITVEPVPEESVDDLIREISALTTLISKETAFPPHPGNRCLSCPYQTVCEAAGGASRKTEFHGLHDPEIRVTEYYLDLLDRRDRILGAIRDAEKALEIRAQKDDIQVFRDINSKPVLDVQRHYRLPRRGSRARDTLENVLKSSGYSGKLQAAAIINWLETSRPEPECLETIRRVMSCRIKFNLREP